MSQLENVYKKKFLEKRFELTALYDCRSLWLYPYIAESLCLWNYQGGEILHGVFSLLTKNRQSIVLELKIIYIGKGDLISESFSIYDQISQKKMPKTILSTYIKMLRIVIWHLFWKIWPKVKNSLRLSHLFKNNLVQLCTRSKLKEVYSGVYVT